MLHSIKHEFVEFIPGQIEEGVLYVSMEYATAVHKCFCGCGMKVVTPFDPTDWEITFDGVTVSLYPSIGNWEFPCQSHYWIENNKVRRAKKWTKTQIAEGRALDRQRKGLPGITNGKPTGRKRSWLSNLFFGGNGKKEKRNEKGKNG